MRTRDDAWRQVERGLSSAGRLRILRALASKGEASQTRYSLERVTGLKPIDVRKHLQVLIDTGWVTEHDVTPPVYTLNLDDPKAQWLVDFLEKMGCL
jgi:DNA-binding transcriptional ArsR family regulator